MFRSSPHLAYGPHKGTFALPQWETETDGKVKVASPAAGPTKSTSEPAPPRSLHPFTYQLGLGRSAKGLGPLGAALLFLFLIHGEEGLFFYSSPLLKSSLTSESPRITRASSGRRGFVLTIIGTDVALPYLALPMPIAC